MVSTIVQTGCSQGNYPEAGSCSEQTPWYAVCTHAQHGLNGWTGPCVTDKEVAEQHATSHAQDLHQGNTRWTGVAHISKAQLLVR